MKTFLILPALAACLCAGVQAQTTPLDNKAVTVTATVLNTCKFAPWDVSLTLGPLDPSSKATVQTATTVEFNCTKDHAVKFSILGGNGNLTVTGGSPTELTLANGASTLPYTLKTTLSGSTGKGFGANNKLSMELTAEFQPSQFQDAPGGIYTGFLTIQLTP